MKNLSEMNKYYSSKWFEEKYIYEKADLGLTYSREKSTFRMWSPDAKSAKIKLYYSGDIENSDLAFEIPMEKNENGLWQGEKEGDLVGLFYTYEVKHIDSINETIDPYAKAGGINGDRAMIIDLKNTNPDGWDMDKNPNSHLEKTSIIIYEASIRDLTINKSSGISNEKRGKYLGLTEMGTVNEIGQKTALSHILDLGVTHLQLLPFNDFGSTDEKLPLWQEYNWGYDPKNYNFPEGSYSSDPYDGSVRIKELKTMIKTLHDNGLSVVMDVVYNHVYEKENFSINKLMPDYFSRADERGYSNGSGCGNDTASERIMVRKFIVDSLLFWAEEYHIDGFRFDLAGLIDVETINLAAQKLKKKRPDIILYGEGWIMDTNMVKDNILLTNQQNIDKLEDFSFFNDSFRDGVKGNVFDEKSGGFISENHCNDHKVLAGLLGSTNPWSKSPYLSINYVSAHDNHTLWDKIYLSSHNKDIEKLMSQNRLAAALNILAQGIPFIHSGDELLRSKRDEQGNIISNSYNSGDFVNSIKWDNLNHTDVQNIKDYYKGLISFRKSHTLLRLKTRDEVKKHISFYESLPENLIALRLDGLEDFNEEIVLIFNGRFEDMNICLPGGDWDLYISSSAAGNIPLETGFRDIIKIPSSSAMAFIKSK